MSMLNSTPSWIGLTQKASECARPILLVAGVFVAGYVTQEANMGCNCGGGAKRTVHQVRRSDGTVKRYATEAEAKAAASQPGATYTKIER